MEGRSVSTWILLLLGIGGTVNGLIMLFASEPWFASIWAARVPRWRTPLATAAALFLGLHGLIHVFEVASGVQPPAHLLEDFPGVYLPALLLAGIAVRSRERKV